MQIVSPSQELDASHFAGIMQYKKDDWRSLENKQCRFVISPYEQLSAHVMFAHGTASFISVYLQEAIQVWRHVLPVAGTALQFSESKFSKWVPFYYTMPRSGRIGYILSRDVDDGVDLLIKWVVFVITVTCIFQNSYGHKLYTSPMKRVAVEIFRTLDSDFPKFY
ncbi:hypothetical protein Tco_1391282 [Tanacetum coccineum]